MKMLFFTLALISTLALTPQQVLRYQPLTMVPVYNPMTPLPILEYVSGQHGTRLRWGTEGRNYAVRYTDTASLLDHLVVFDSHGVIIRREDEVSLDNCPEGLRTYFLRNHPHEALRIWTCLKESEMRYYFRKRFSIVWFDKDGNYLKTRPSWL